MTKPFPPERHPEDDLMIAATAYLRAIGVDPVVVGGVQIIHDPRERLHNHQLVVRFTAVLPLRVREERPEEMAIQLNTVCPVCGAVVEASATGWRCVNGHGQ